ncbi:MAG: phospholipase D-like domain-containing protein [Candidatus Babeliales bacterium]
MKKLLFILISLFSYTLVGSEQGDFPSPKKLKGEESPEVSEVQVVQENPLVLAIKKEIFALNPEQLAKVLEEQGIEQIDKKTKDDLLELASSNNKKFINFALLASKFGQPFTSKDLQEKLNFGIQIKSTKRIENYLKAFILLERGFKFPQAFFNPAPYIPNDPRPSLDDILKALIKNEQEKIQVCCFHFTLYNVADCLVQQKNNEGVCVEVLTNQDQGENPVLQPLEHLISNGIVVKAPVRNNCETNHHKFVIFTANVGGKSLVWHGSYNMTGHSNKRSWEEVTILNDSYIINQFIDRFNEISNLGGTITLDILNTIQTNPSPCSYDINNVPAELRK